MFLKFLTPFMSLSNPVSPEDRLRELGVNDSSIAEIQDEILAALNATDLSETPFRELTLEDLGDLTDGFTDEMRALVTSMIDEIRGEYNKGKGGCGAEDEHDEIKLFGAPL